MDIGLGLNQILAMAKKKPHPDKPDKNPAPEIDPVPAPEPVPVPEPAPAPQPEPAPAPQPEPAPQPAPVPGPVPKPAPDAAIPGVMDASEIVVLGSPVMEAAFGSPEPAPEIAAYAAEAGFTGRLRVYRDGGEDFALSRQALQKAQADVQVTEGSNLYLLHSGAETVAATRPYPSGAETLAAEYRDLVGEAASKGDKVIPVPLTKVLYGRGEPGYPNNPRDVVDGNPATEAFGTQPYNQEIFYPALRDSAPGWAPDHLTSDKLAARLTLTVNRPSVVAGEAIYLKIDGLTDEEAATWGFLWEFDTSGEFRYLSDLPWHMRQKNRATGHHQTAAWDTPGIKTVTVRVVPPVWSGLKGTVLTVDVENRDPDVEFEAARTWVVAPDGDFTGAPEGVQVTTWNEVFAGLSAEDSGRVRFKRGTTLPFLGNSGTISRNYTGGVMFDAWGPETDPDPVIDVSEQGFNWSRPEMCPFILIKDISFIGGYDVVTGASEESHSVWRFSENSHWTFHGCNFEKVKQATETLNMDELTDNMVAVYDCRITAWEHYGIYVQSVEKLMIRGSYICQDPMAPAVADGKLGRPVNYPDHGPLRLTKGAGQFGQGVAVVCSQLQLFSCNAWTQGSAPTDGSGVKPMAHQGVLRLGTLTSENMNVLLSEIYSEGGPYTLGGGNAGYIVGAGFLAMHGCYHIAGANWNGVSFGMTGAWAHSNVLVIPDVPREDTNSATWGGFGPPDKESSSHTESWASKPVHIFNNTVAWMLSPANTYEYPGNPNAPVKYSDIMGSSMAATATTPEVTLQNNVVWAPNTTFVGEDAPRVPDGIYSAGAYGPTPLYRGKHFMNAAGELEFNPEYATPADAAILPLLSKDSTLCGTADKSLVGALDFFGRVRGTEPTVGSVERNLSDVLNPIVDPYELADRHPQLLGEAGAQAYGLSLGRYLLARVAAGALGIERGASRAGRSVLYNVGQGHPDEMAIGEVNRIRSLTDYTGFPLLCGAKFRDGGFNPFIEVDVEPDFDTGVTYDGLFSHPRIGDPRFLLDEAINTGLSLSGGKTYRLHFGGLTPGDRMTVSCVGITTSTGARRGDLVLSAGTQTLTEVLDAASDAVSNMAVFAPVTVPGSGRISLSLTPQKGASNAFLSSVLLDFA